MSEKELYLHTFGTQSILRGSQPLNLRDKEMALLIYLAINGRSFTRAHLADLFWPERPPEKRPINMRAAVRRLTSEFPLAPYLDVDDKMMGMRLGSRYWVDALAFQARLEEATTLDAKLNIPSLTYAITLYRGPFAAGFNLPDLEEFNEWVQQQQPVWQRRQLTALALLIKACIHQNQLDAGVEHAHTLLQLNPEHDDAHRYLAWLYAAQGQAEQAAQISRQYEEQRQKNALQPDPTIPNWLPTANNTAEKRPLPASTSDIPQFAPESTSPGPLDWDERMAHLTPAQLKQLTAVAQLPPEPFTWQAADLLLNLGTTSADALDWLVKRGVLIKISATQYQLDDSLRTYLQTKPS